MLSKYKKNIATLLSGTFLAQLIPVLITPILTRLYTPHEFGIFALFTSISLVISTLCCGRYELAINLPKLASHANYLLYLCFFLSAAFASIIFIAILIFGEYLNQLIDFDYIILYLIPFAVLFSGCINSLNYMAVRNKQFKLISIVNVIRSLVLCFCQLILGYFYIDIDGLIIGSFISIIFGFYLLYRNVSYKKSHEFFNKNRISSLAKRYKDFPKYSLTASAANVVSKNLIVMLIPFYYGVSLLGFYSLVYKLLSMPITLIARSISQVFLQDISERKRNNTDIYSPFYKAVIVLSIISVVSFTCLYFVVEDVFTIVFGTEWAEAGYYAKIMIPLFCIRFIVSPLTVINQVNNQNKLGMIWQVLLLLITVVLFLMFGGVEFELFLNLYVAVQSICYLIFLWMILSHVRMTAQS